MPFDFVKYDAKCATLDGDALQLEWEHYTRLISGAAASTTVSGMAVPFTLGVSTIGVGFAAPAIHNARKKREIIERHLQQRGRTHNTRKRDVITGGAISGAVAVATLGMAPVGADIIGNAAAEHGMTSIVENELATKIGTHLALDTAGLAAEEAHAHHKKEKQAWKAYAKALKAGKNPPLFASYLKVPVLPNTQPVNQSFGIPVQQLPAVSIVPPAEQPGSVQTSAVNFPPPPSPVQGGLAVSDKHNRRHSMSSLSVGTQADENWQQQQEVKPKPHYMYGTSTAISAPMAPGQNYWVDACESKSGSTFVVSTEQSVAHHTLQPEVILTQQQILTSPAPPPPPPYATQEKSSTQRLRAYSAVSANSSSYCPPPWQPQTSLATSRSHSPPSAPLISPPSLYPSMTPSTASTNSIQTPAATDYFGASTVPTYQPKQDRNNTMGHVLTPRPSYDPSQYNPSQYNPSQYNPSQYNPSQYNPQPQPQSRPQPTQSYPTEKQDANQVPYFPPPPHAC